MKDYLKTEMFDNYTSVRPKTVKMQIFVDIG
jgi:hypothetical protein